MTKLLFRGMMGLGLSLCWIAAFGADPPLTVTTLAGSPGAVSSSADGTGTAAQFASPRGIAVDAAGNVYVADSSNHSIRKITPAGVVTTLAGTPGTAGTVNATPAAFNEPFSLVVDATGTLYVADTNNNAIRKITPAGVVSTLAGGNGSGAVDGTGSAAKFHEPRGLALDSAGNLFVADYENNIVRKVTPAGVVTTLAGAANTPGNVNGQGTAARFMLLNSIAVDAGGNVYVADAGARALRKISPTGLVTTLAGATPGTFSEPRGVALDASGNIWMSDYGAHTLVKVSAAGVVSKIAGTSFSPGTADGTATALFYSPSGMAFDSSNNVVLADTGNHTIRKVTVAGAVTTLAGLAGRSSSVDGQGTSARFEEPYSIATDGTYVFLADHSDHSIRKISADGTVTTLAGKAGSYGSTDGTGASARFFVPSGIAVDSAGTVVVADTNNSVIRKISPAGVVTTLAGTAKSKGTSDGVGAAARFAAPAGVAVDRSGNVYVADSEASTVRKITPSGVVTTLAGGAYANGFVNGSGTAARFNVPSDLALDSDGNILVLDRNNHAVRKVTPLGEVTTLAGSGTPGLANGKGTAAQFSFPSGLTVDSLGNVVVADTDNQVLRKITPSGDVTTLAGSRLGSADGTATAAQFYNPKDIAADAQGNFYVADKNNRTVRKLSPTAVPNSAPADCLFNWAERSFSQFFAPAGGASQTLAPYYYRYYAATSTYLATVSTDNSVYAMGPATGGQAVRLGSLADLLTTAGCPQ